MGCLRKDLREYENWVLKTQDKLEKAENSVKWNNAICVLHQISLGRTKTSRWKPSERRLSTKRVLYCVYFICFRSYSFR